MTHGHVCKAAILPGDPRVIRLPWEADRLSSIPFLMEVDLDGELLQIVSPDWSGPISGPSLQPQELQVLRDLHLTFGIKKVKLTRRK